MRRTFAAAALALLAGALAATPARADGCLIAPWLEEIYQSHQLAYLAFDADAGREELHLLPRIYGDAETFAWIVPVPDLPELAVSDVEIFRQLADLTAPEYRSRDQGWGCEEEAVYSPAAANGGVDILDTQLVGIYQTMIVAADDAGALTDSLTAWGFLNDDNTDEVAPVLASYVDQGWAFVTLKVDDSAFEDIQYDGYWYGVLQPIRLTFAAAAPVYPMRISKLSAAEDTAVILYVKSDRRLDFDGAATLYANVLNAHEARAVAARYPALAPLLAEGDWLTKLQRSYTPQQMDADIQLEPADTDAEFHRIYYSGLPLTAGLLLLLFSAGLAFRFRWTARERP